MALDREHRNNSEVSGHQFKAKGISYYQIFRLTFVLFIFYTAGDVFYRGDGMTFYYASYSAFIPTLALVIIFWSSIAIFVSIFLWLSGKSFEWFSSRIGCQLKMEHYLLFVGTCFISGATAWISKTYVINRGTTLQEKLIVLLSVILFAIFLTWLCRNKIKMWFEIIQRLISPLVWLSGILVVVSIILVVCSTW